LAEQGKYLNKLLESKDLRERYYWKYLSAISDEGNLASFKMIYEMLEKYNGLKVGLQDHIPDYYSFLDEM